MTAAMQRRARPWAAARWASHAMSSVMSAGRGSCIASRAALRASYWAIRVRDGAGSSAARANTSAAIMGGRGAGVVWVVGGTGGGGVIARWARGGGRIRGVPGTGAGGCAAAGGAVRAARAVSRRPSVRARGWSSHVRGGPRVKVASWKSADCRRDGRGGAPGGKAAAVRSRARAWPMDPGMAYLAAMSMVHWRLWRRRARGGCGRGST